MAFTSIISGTRTSGTLLAGNNKPDIDSVLKVLKPYQTPLMQKLFFSTRKSKPVTSSHGKFSWFEDEFMPHQTAVAEAGVTASGGKLPLTTSNVGRILHLKVGDIVYIEANDVCGYVESNNGTTASIGHIDGSTSLNNVTVAGSFIKTIGSMYSEIAGTPTALSTTPIEKYNYLTKFQEAVKTTGRVQAGQTYTDGMTHAEQVAKKMEEMKLQFERNFIFSLTSGSRASADGTPVTWGQGALGRITSVVSASYTTLTEAIWDAYLLSLSAKGGDSKTHYCGSGQFNALQGIIKAKVGSLPAVVKTEYGVRVTSYLHSSVQINLVMNPVFDGKFANWGVTLDDDPQLVTGRHMANDLKGSRKFRVENNVETPGSDYTETKLMADIGIQIKSEECHGKIYI